MINSSASTKNICRVLLSFCLLAQCVLTSSCKSRGQHSKVKDSRNSGSILIVASGGWMSCAKGGGLGTTPIKSWIYDSAMAVVEDLGKISNRKVDYLVSCLGLRAPNAPLAPLWYVTPTSRDSYRVRAQDFPNVIAEHINRTKPEKVYLVGHSYGGWVISNALERGSFQATSAFGLDFIDANKCVVIDGLDGEYGSGCRQAPDLNYRTILSKLSRSFYNYWQNKGPIHSAPIQVSGASNYENIEWNVSHPKLSDPNLAHRFIGFDAGVWQKVCTDIAGEMSLDGGSCRKIETNERGHAVGSNSDGFTVDHRRSGNGQDPVDDPKSSEGASHIICEKTTVDGIPWRVEVKDGDGDSEFVLTATRGQDQLYGRSSVEMTLFRRMGEGGVQFRSTGGSITLDLTSGSLPVVGKFTTERYGKNVTDLQCRAGSNSASPVPVNPNPVNPAPSTSKSCSKTTSNGIQWNISITDIGGGQFELSASRGNQRLYGPNVQDGNLRLKQVADSDGTTYVSDKGTVWLKVPRGGLARFWTERYEYNVTDLVCSP